MGLRPIALDVGHAKETLCKSHGAEFYVDVTNPNAIQEVNNISGGGCHGVLCVATSFPAYNIATDICRRKGCLVCVGVPVGNVRGSVVGTRQDMIEALDFVDRRLVKCTVQTKKLDEINDVIAKLKKNAFEG